MHKTSFAGVASTFLLCFLFWILLTWSADVQELATGAVISLRWLCSPPAFSSMKNPSGSLTR